ncbi:MAG: phosphotransferase family protein [Candidatus Dormiibacterota bacterium]
MSDTSPAKSSPPAEPMPLDQLRERLEGYLRQDLGSPGLSLIAMNPIPEGHSGFTYFIDAVDGGEDIRYVLRLPPPGARIAGPADVLRQGRIMAALNQRGLPTPRIVANCDDPDVLDGRPFCLMEAVEGDRIEPFLKKAKPIAIAQAAVDTLRRLQEVPLDQTGLGGEPAVSLDEEMMRWAWLMSKAPEELTQAAPGLGTRLAAKKPADPAPTLVHADYHYGNMLFRLDSEGRPEVVAVLDWEISEIGAPLIDLGCLCIVAQRNQVPGAPNPGGGIELDVDEVIDLYGADPDEARWYLALSCYKYASIFGYNLMLHRRGKRPDVMYESLTGVIMALVENGSALLE